MRTSSYITGTDMFCGAGGTTTGAVAAGVEMKMAMNHWDLAIETHNKNHPNTDHHCANISESAPRYFPRTTILYSSPECTKHSNAAGKKRKGLHQMDLFNANMFDAPAERSRATMWDVPRFAEVHKYEIIIVENVVEVRSWAMFNAWLIAMQALGYRHQCKYLNSQFFGVPQSRDRIFIVFWKKGNKMPDLEHRPIAPCTSCGDKESYQKFKNPNKKWGKYGKKGQYVYRCSSCYEEVVPYYNAAYNVIDWDVPITRIGDRKNPLVPNTIKRIKHGLNKFPYPIQFHSEAYQNNVRPGNQPLYTQTTRQEQYVMIQSAIINLRKNGASTRMDKPISTVSAGGINHGLLVGNYTPGWCRPLNLPVGSITTSAQQGLVIPGFMSYYYGSDTFGGFDQPINTIRTVDCAAIVQSASKVEDCFYRVIKDHEVKKAMAFPDDYEILGSRVKDRVRQLGNAVTPPVMKWLTERAVASLK